jgi:hypothetical protein
MREIAAYNMVNPYGRTPAVRYAVLTRIQTLRVCSPLGITSRARSRCGRSDANNTTVRAHRVNEGMKDKTGGSMWAPF